MKSVVTSVFGSSLVALLWTLPLSAQVGDVPAEGPVLQDPVRQDEVQQEEKPGQKGEQGEQGEEQQKEQKPKVLKIGDQVDPTLVLKDLFGKEHHLVQKKDDKVTLLVFYSIQCPWMKPALPKLQAVQEEYAKRGVTLLAINSNVTEIGKEPQKATEKEDGTMTVPYFDQVEHHKKHGLKFPVLVDHGNVVADLFAATATPHCFVIDTKGVLRYEGGIDDDPRGAKSDEEREDWLRLALDAVLAGEKVEKAETREHGCTIKRIAAKGEPKGRRQRN